MEHGAFEEESRRFAVALAAAEVAEQKISMIEGPLEVSRRSYFYATPEKTGRYHVEKLNSLIHREKCPVLVDWDRDSEHFGLRYTVKDQPVRAELKTFQGKDAQADWKAWRSKEKSVSKVVALAAQEAVKGKPLTFLDVDPDEVTSDRPPRQTDMEL